MMIQVYQTKIEKISGTDFREVHQKALFHYSLIRKRSRRRPYIRSAFFNRKKVFLNLFWAHLYEKPNFRDKTRRLRFFPCALDLLSRSRFRPMSKPNPNRNSEILHRFSGVTPTGEFFIVQVKEIKRSNQKYFMSVFPYD